MAVQGVGVDLIEISRIQDIVTRKPAIVSRILSEAEQKDYNAIVSDKRRYEYLAGRWAVKEALGKALKTGVFPHHGFTDVSVLNAASGAPYIVTSLIDSETQQTHVSLTHTDTYAAAIVIIEEQ
ncbi:MAG: holo-ACP synthase [Aerococcus sp.]|nr:holo-ACP synthase [Aerococcus sp.]